MNTIKETQEEILHHLAESLDDTPSRPALNAMASALCLYDATFNESHAFDGKRFSAWQEQVNLSK